ncbi:MAG: glycosyltransferase family 2 protein [Bacteroidales bacterium]|nr:glycosyltransferase family 2 protein [Bacteroidales bacterium]
MAQPRYSVVVPVYNSEETLEELFDRSKLVFEKLGAAFEFVFVEDCGTDHSWDVLKSLKKKHPDQITAIKLHRNYGQHNATICGFSFARGEVIITIDDDLQHPPEEMHKLISRFEETDADIVYGVFRKKQHSRLRNISSKSVKSTSRLLLKGTGKGSSFRLIKKEMIGKLLDHTIHFVFIDQLLLWHTNDFEFVEVDHHKRRIKKSGYTAKKLFMLATDLTYFYTNIPLKLMVYGGLIMSLVFFLLGLRFILQKWLFNVTVPGYTSTIVTILFSTGIIVFSLGIIGGYLSRIYMVQTNKPPFTVKKVL